MKNQIGARACSLMHPLLRLERPAEMGLEGKMRYLLSDVLALRCPQTDLWGSHAKLDTWAGSWEVGAEDKALQLLVQKGINRLPSPRE